MKILNRLLNSGPRYPWKKVMMIVLLSSCCISGGSSGVYFFYLYIKHLQIKNPSSVIQAIVQKSPHYAPLQTTCLAEILELSYDLPHHLSQFDVKEAHERLMGTHIIQKAQIKKIKPNSLYIDYTLRMPIAYLGDYTNTALDEEGVFFPSLPFYSPRVLPEIYLGMHAPAGPWGERLTPQQLLWVHEILARFPYGTLQRIDLSQSEAPSAGMRQIVLIVEEGTILRLTPKNYVKELTHYFMLASHMTKKARVIDLRNPGVAYISHEKQWDELRKTHPL